MEENLDLRNRILHYFNEVTCDLNELGASRRESYRAYMKDRYGPGGVKYDPSKFRNI